MLVEYMSILFYLVTIPDLRMNLNRDLNCDGSIQETHGDKLASYIYSYNLQVICSRATYIY